MGSSVRTILITFLFCALGILQSLAKCSDTVAAIVLVDPFFNTGKLIAPQAGEKGLVRIFVRSSAEWPNGARESFSPDHYEIHIDPNDEAGVIVADLMRKVAEHSVEIGKNIEIKAVMTGAETGVALQDVLSAALRVPGNDPKTSDLRMDKGKTANALKEAGVRVAHSYSTSSLEAALAWADGVNKWPLVLKPPKSSGSDSVYVCRNVSDFREAFSAIIDHPNQMKQKNENVLIQEYLEGPQYIVDMLNVQEKGPDGNIRQKRVLTDIWHQVRGADYPVQVYDHNRLLKYDEEAHRILEDYSARVLDVVGLNVGFSHLEVILTKDGPVVVDVNPRLVGGGIPKLIEKATGNNVIDAAIDTHLGVTPKFISPYSVKKHAALVYLRTHGNARMSERMRGELEQLRSEGLISDFTFNFKEGDLLNPSIDSDTIIGKVEVLNEDPEKVQQVIDLIRKWESEKKFEQ